ncbi:hypothetical protein N6H14_00560 [Paenibacillus sp. CC-CFT747]|nr:hypothetical protein N6H14_00560 [Paenibacillus sp. CC-CFT747]
MTRMKVRIAVSRDRDETFVYLPRTLIKKLKLPEGLPIRLKAGAYEQYVRVMSAPRLTDMRLSEGLLDRAGLEAGSQLCIRYKDRTLALGPLIGVLLRGVPSKNPERPFGNITSFCQELIQAGEQYGAQVFFFTPSGAADTASLRGWTFSGRWKQRRFPLPDVVYNRLTSRIIEGSEAIQSFMREAKSQGVHIFNERYLNKAEVFEALGKERGSLLICRNPTCTKIPA